MAAAFQVRLVGRPLEGSPEEDGPEVELEGPPAEPLGPELEGPPEELLGLEELGCEFEGAPDELLDWGVGLRLRKWSDAAQPPKVIRPSNATMYDLFTIPPP